MIRTKRKGLKAALACAVMFTVMLSAIPQNGITTQKVEAYGEAADGYYYAETWLYDYDYDASNFGYTKDNQQSYNNDSAGVHYNWDQCHNLRNGDRWMTGLQVPYESLNRDISAFYSGKSAPALYLGNFYGTATDLSDTRGNGKGETPWQYTYKTGDNNYHSYANVYNNFWQSANNAPKTSNGNVAVQGLVDRTLDSSGNLTQGNGSFELPYFSDSFINSNSKMHKYATSNGFPFNITTGSNGIKTYGFDSAYDNKRYYQNGEIKVGTETNHPKGTVNWRSDQKTVTGGDYGFYPFNGGSNITNMVVGRSAVNYGFGMKVNIPFNLSETGTLTDKDGNPVDPVFNFSGDDDVWVFVDGVLMLDIGGDHAKVTGSINFNRSKQNVYVSKVAPFNSSASKTQRASETGAQNTTIAAQFTAAGKGFNADEFYDPNTEHVLTVFYMERGMFESNLSISFNFAPVNPHKLTVKERTEFTNVNPGLLKQTVGVADKDIFDYSIENKGTTANDAGNSGILTPTYTYIDRNNTDSGNTTLINRLSGQEPQYTPGGTAVDNDHIYLNPTWSGGTWDKDGAVLMAWVWKSGQNGKYVRFEKDTATGLFKIDNDNYAGIIVRRFNGSNPAPVGGTTYDAGDPWDTASQLTVTNNNNKINITGWDNSAGWDSNKVTVTTEPVLIQESHSFTPTSTTAYNPVGSTTYRLTDPFGVLTNSTTPETTLTRDTTSNGHFRLMYGEDAFFQSQFKKDSTMRVKQSATLAKPKNNRATTMGSDDGTRAVATYYNTSVKVEDADDTLLFSKSVSQFNDYNADGTYTYANAPESTTKTVHLKETYTNTIKVGDLVVQKSTVNANETNKDFTFNLTLTNLFGDTVADVDISSLKYEVFDGTTVGDFYASTGTEGSVSSGIKIKAGQYAVIKGIPVETKYTLTEAADDDYTQKSASNMSGTIKEGNYTYGDDGYITSVDPAGAFTASAVNERKTGKLTVKKTVSVAQGDTVDTNAKFSFTVALTAPAGVDFGNYIVNRNVNVDSITAGVTDLSITSTGFFTFKAGHNDSITFKNIPYGTTYTVTETKPDGYTVSYSYGDNGKIINKNGPEDTVTVTNTKDVVIKATIRIKKYDNRNNPLKGAQFTMYNTMADAQNKTNPVSTGTLANDGKEFVFSDLELNKTYYFAETTVPDGYTGVDPFSITTNGDATEKVVNKINTLIEIVMPETGGTPFMVDFSVVGVLAIGLAVLALVIYKKKLQS